MYIFYGDFVLQLCASRRGICLACSVLLAVDLCVLGRWLYEGFALFVTMATPGSSTCYFCVFVAIYYLISLEGCMSLELFFFVFFLD